VRNIVDQQQRYGGAQLIQTSSNNNITEPQHFEDTEAQINENLRYLQQQQELASKYASTPLTQQRYGGGSVVEQQLAQREAGQKALKDIELQRQKQLESQKQYQDYKGQIEAVKRENQAYQEGQNAVNIINEGFAPNLSDRGRYYYNLISNNENAENKWKQNIINKSPEGYKPVFAYVNGNLNLTGYEDLKRGMSIPISNFVGYYARENYVNPVVAGIIGQGLVNEDIQGFSGLLYPAYTEKGAVFSSLTERDIVKAQFLNQIMGTPIPQQYGTYYKERTPEGKQILTNLGQYNKSILPPKEQLMYNYPAYKTYPIALPPTDLENFNEFLGKIPLPIFSLGYGMGGKYATSSKLFQASELPLVMDTVKGTENVIYELGKGVYSIGEYNLKRLTEPSIKQYFGIPTKKELELLQKPEVQNLLLTTGIVAGGTGFVGQALFGTLTGISIADLIKEPTGEKLAMTSLMVITALFESTDRFSTLLRLSKETGLSIGEIKLLSEYNKYGIKDYQEFERQYGKLGLSKDYIDIIRNAKARAFDYRGYDFGDIKITKGGTGFVYGDINLDITKAIQKRIDTIERTFPEVPRMSAELTNILISINKDMQRYNIVEGSKAKTIYEQLRLKNPVKYQNTIYEKIVKDAETNLAKSNLFESKESLTPNTKALGFTKEEIIQSKTSLNKGDYVDSFIKKRTDITTFKQSEVNELAEAIKENFPAISPKDLQFTFKGTIKDMRQFTTYGMGQYFKNEEYYDKYLEKLLKSGWEGTVVPPELQSSKVVGIYRQQSLNRIGVLIGEGDIAEFRTFNIRKGAKGEGRQFISEATKERIKVSLSKNARGDFIEVKTLTYQDYNTNKQIEVIRSLQDIQREVKPMPKTVLKSDRAFLEYLQNEKIKPQELGFISKGKGEAELTYLIKQKEGITKVDINDFGYNFQQVQVTKLGQYLKVSEFVGAKDVLLYGKDDFKLPRDTLKEVFGIKSEGLILISKEKTPETIDIGGEVRNLVQLKDAIKPQVSVSIEPEPVSMTKYNKAINKEMGLDYIKNFGESELINKNLGENIEMTLNPTIETSISPTIESTINPTIEFTLEPTIEMTIEPTIETSISPTIEVTIQPTIQPTISPTINPMIEINARNNQDYKNFLLLLKDEKKRQDKQQKGQAFQVYVKEPKQKQFKQIPNKVLNKQDAENLGSYLVDNSVSRTWFIKPVNQKPKPLGLNIPDEYFEATQDKFRQYKIKQGKHLKINGYIEKSNYLLDTEGEIQQLSAFKQLAKLNKQSKNGGSSLQNYALSL